MSTLRTWSVSLAAGLAISSLASPLTAQVFDAPQSPREDFVVYQELDGTIVAIDANSTQAFNTWSEYAASSFFIEHNARCSATTQPLYQGLIGSASTSDCSSNQTNADAQYAPGPLYRIPVVVHIFMNTSGAGAITDQMVQSQIDVLNEDFLAIPGTNGGPGNDSQIEFFLATTDPQGNPTSGITRHTNNDWYNDNGDYWNSVGWDTNEYLNIYTNTAAGNLGYAYVPSGGGVVGHPQEGVRVLWSAFGRNAPIGPPYNLGRTTTHEVGHYLGLYHTFQGGCQGGPCHKRGDLICDTNKESQPNYDSCSRSTCNSPDPTTNYMDYSDDICMNEFTSDQLRRMRCTIEAFRTDLPEVTDTLPGQATNPSPSDGASSVSTGTSLSWNAGTGATSNDVYFGTNSTPGAGDFQGNQAGTSFSPGTLAEGTTYYWRIDSVNGTGTTTGAVWSFSTASGGGTGNTLFSDDFESGGLSAGGWTTSNSNSKAAGGAAFSGSWGAELKRTTSIERAISTAGATNVRLSYDCRTIRLDGGEFLAVEWYDGSSWNLVQSTSSTSWANQDASLPSGADNNASFRIRFSLNANRNNEKAYLDNVSVEAD